jgi:transposase
MQTRSDLRRADWLTTPHGRSCLRRCASCRDDVGRSLRCCQLVEPYAGLVFGNVPIAEPLNIPPRCNRNEPICFSPYLYRARNLVERFFNRIKQCRRIATRYDKLAANYLAFVQLASIRLWLRVNESTPEIRR